jgi:DNA-binding transcriptional MocR family regulator
MSWDHVLWAAREAHVPAGDATAHHVLVVIATHANREGRAWPGVATIARETGLHPGTVRRAVQRLETAGLLEVIHRYGRSCEYLFHSPPDPARSARYPPSFCAPPRAQRATEGSRKKKEGTQHFAFGSGWVKDWTGGDHSHWGEWR